MAAQVNYEVTYQKEYHPDRFSGRPQNDNHYQGKYHKEKSGSRVPESAERRYPTVVADVSRSVFDCDFNNVCCY